MNGSRLFRPSSRPAGHGITIGTPRLYDLFAQLIFLGTRRRAYRTLIAAAGVRSGDRVLDIGCGPGSMTRLLAEVAGPGGSAVGIDAAPEMIAYAQGKARRFSNCTFEVGTAEALAFADRAFDVVMSSLMVHHLPEELKGQAAGEMYRVLRPGGTLLLADFTIPSHGGWHLVGALHRPRAMLERVSPLEPLVEAAGFSEVQSGDDPPWLHYARATKP